MRLPVSANVTDHPVRAVDLPLSKRPDSRTRVHRMVRRSAVPKFPRILMRSSPVVLSEHTRFDSDRPQRIETLCHYEARWHEKVVRIRRSRERPTAGRKKSRFRRARVCRRRFRSPYRSRLSSRKSFQDQPKIAASIRQGDSQPFGVVTRHRGLNLKRCKPSSGANGCPR